MKLCLLRNLNFVVKCFVQYTYMHVFKWTITCMPPSVAAVNEKVKNNQCHQKTYHCQLWITLLLNFLWRQFNTKAGVFMYHCLPKILPCIYQQSDMNKSSMKGKKFPLDKPPKDQFWGQIQIHTPFSLIHKKTLLSLTSIVHDQSRFVFVTIYADLQNHKSCLPSNASKSCVWELNVVKQWLMHTSQW